MLGTEFVPLSQQTGIIDTVYNSFTKVIDYNATLMMSDIKGHNLADDVKLIELLRENI